MSKISMKNGVDGPPWDPYGYVEYTFTGKCEVTLHLGLAEWIRVDGFELEVPNPTAAFETLTDLTIDRCQKIYDRLHGPQKSCRNCHGKAFDWKQGFPGESLQICTKCQTIVHCAFNESEVM